MKSVSSVAINLGESFPHLPGAPIVEAVIEIRARAQTPWDEPAISAWLTSRLPDYPTMHAQNEFRFEFLKRPGVAEQTHRDLGLKGLRFESADKLHVAQLNRDGFVFSRLQPYDCWHKFQGEALRLWNIHAELAKPLEIERLGLRFINRINVPMEGVRLKDYLQAPPCAPLGMSLPITGFLHQATLTVPGHPYLINLIQTLQPQIDESGAIGLIVDIDVGTIDPFPLEGAALEQRLAEMRWLKNKAFFGCITDKALERFQ